MKEILEKFFNLFNEGIQKMETDGDNKEAIAKFAEANALSGDLLKKSEETEDLAKFLDTDSGKETLKKYVDMYLSSSDMTILKKELDELAGKSETLTKKVEKLEKEKGEDDEVITKALNSYGDEIEDIKKTLETPVSKIK